MSRLKQVKYIFLVVAITPSCCNQVVLDIIKMALTALGWRLCCLPLDSASKSPSVFGGFEESLQICQQNSSLSSPAIQWAGCI